MKLGISTPTDLLWIDLDQGTLILGRSGSCSVSLSDPVLSRQHCAITRDANKVTCSDLGSSNGTYHGGELIERVDLQHGSIVEIGESALLLITENGEPGEEETSFRFPERVTALRSSIPATEDDSGRTTANLFDLGPPGAQLLDEVLVDHVISELLKMLTHTDEEFRSRLTSTIDRALSENLLNTSTDLNQLRSRIREILEEDRP